MVDNVLLSILLSTRRYLQRLQPQRVEVAYTWCTTNLIQVVAKIDSPCAVKMIQPRFTSCIQ